MRERETPKATKRVREVPKAKVPVKVVPRVGVKVRETPRVKAQIVTVMGFWDEPLHSYRGIPQSYYIDQFIDLERDPHAGYILMPIAGFPVLMAASLPGFGRDHFRQMRGFAGLGGLLVLLHDQSAGSVRKGNLGRPEIRYDLEAGDRRQLAEGVRHCAQILFAAGARRVVVPTQPDPRPRVTHRVWSRRRRPSSPRPLHPARPLPEPSRVTTSARS